MRYHKFSIAESAVHGATHRVTVTYADLSGTAATSLDTQLLPETASTTLPADTTLELISCKVVTAFVGASITVLTLKIGDDTDDDRYMTTTYGDLLTATQRSIPRAVLTQPFTLTSADTIDAIFTATGANLTALTAGQVDLYVRIVPSTERPAG